MHHLTYTQSRCFTNVLQLFGARRRHHQGAPSQMLAVRQIILNYCPTICCGNVALTHDTRYTIS